MSEAAILLDVACLSKSFPTYASNLARFARWFGAPVEPVSTFEALSDVSFTLRAGEAVALVGQNGAGKSTLLKLVTGTMRPTAGSVAVNGRINAILELGVGFNPEFTGRRNVEMAGGLMGLSPQAIAQAMAEIEAFTELGDFFDRPLRLYSSGMQARLAFGLATAVRPDILIVDEALSVGDAYFQHKSFDRIRQMKAQGTALLFVSHNMGDVRALCDRALLLDKGRVLKDGPPDLVADFYNAIIAAKEEERASVEQTRRPDGWLETRSGSYEATLGDVTLRDAASGARVEVARTGQKLRLEIDAKAAADVPSIVLGVMLRDRAGHVVWGTNTWHTGQALKEVRAGETLRFTLDFVCALGPGSYSVSPALVGSDTPLDQNFEWRDNALVFEVVNDGAFFIGTAALDARFGTARL